MNTTTSATSRNTTLSWALSLSNPVLVNLFYQIGYSVIFLLGFPGNTASFLTFSRVTLRKVSTGCLFVVLAVFDTLYLLMCIFDYLEFGFSVPFSNLVSYSEFCRFRYFVMSISQFASAWILVLVSVDRWVRTRFPFKSGTICTPRKALISVGILLIIDITLHAHLLTPWFGVFFPGLSIAACGPGSRSFTYITFYFFTWNIIQIFTTCIVPATIMSVIVVDISINIRFRKNAVAQRNQTLKLDKNARRKLLLQKQMFILMFGSVCIFLITTLPVGIYKIISPRDANLAKTYMSIITIWTGLGWFQSLLYGISFYVHCLSSNLFRKEFQLQVKHLMGGNPSRVHTIELTQRDRRTMTLHT
ncbi:hypothetical protein I4U23_013333 [Adineta vaga]|nr:hypothetical protein I4U23_013333 [Adineta vaga]